MSDPLEFTLGDLGAGMQITALERGGVGFDLAPHPLFTLVMWDTLAGGPSPVTLVPNHFDAPVVHQAPTGFLITWPNAAGDEVEIEGAVDADAGHLALSVRTRFAIPGAPLAVHAVEVGLKLPPIGDGADNYCMVPIREGQFFRAPLQMPRARCGHPHGFRHLGEWTDFGALGYLHLWDQASRIGLMLRTDDREGRGKILEAEGTPDGTRLAITLLPADNELGSGAPFDAPYLIIVDPLIGDWWDAAQHYRAALGREEHPGLRRGPLATASSYSPRARDARLFLALRGAHGEIEFADYAEETRRVVEYFGTRDVMVWAVAWHRHQQGLLWPDAFPPAPGFAAAAGEIADLGAILIPYAFPGPVNPLTDAYRWSDPPWSQLVQRRHDQIPETRDLPGGDPPGPPLNRHEFLSFARENAREALRRSWLPLIDEVRGARGWYTDTLPGLGGSDHSEDLSPLARGNGAASHSAGLDLYMEDMVTSFRDRVGDWISMGEWFNEMQVPHYEFLSAPVFDLTDPKRRYLPVLQTVWGSHVRLVTFVPGLGIIGGPDRVPAFAWFQALCFHRGILVGPVRTVTEQPGDRLIPHPGETGFNDRWPYEERLYTFAHTLFVEPATILAPFFRGRRLRPLDNDYENSILRDGFRLDVSEPPITITPIAPGVMTSIWLSDEGGPPRIALLLTNWKEVDEDFAIEMRPPRYDALPEQRVLVRIDAATGSRTPLGFSTGVLQHAVTVPARGLVILLIEAVSAP